MLSNRMCEMIEQEIDKIADKGLTTSNIEVAYKLIDMYKDLKTVKGMDDYESGNSYGRHYVKGHYSMNDGDYSRDNYANDMYSRYSQAKYDYRHSRNSGNRQAIMNTLDDYMVDITSKLSDMMRDADTQEERDTIKRYMSKIKEM